MTPQSPCGSRHDALSARSRPARKIFCERLTPFVAVYGRRTHNARASLERIGLTLAGRAGARAAATQRTPVSRTTLLRLVRALPCPRAVAPTVVGVDDFAQRKGRTYGTIVCEYDSETFAQEPRYTVFISLLYAGVAGATIKQP